MADTTFISRDNLSGLIPEQISREIIQGATEQSAVLRMGRRLPNMTSKTTVLNVLDALPTAYFVNGDTGTKGLTSMAWAKKKIYAEEIAVIVPIPEAALDDADYDIWGEVRPRLQEAFGKVIDGAVLFGVNKPASWRDSILATAQAAGNVVYPSVSTDLYDDIMGENGVIAKVEADGYLVNGFMGAIGLRAKLRGLRSTTGEPLYMQTLQQGVQSYSLDGEPIDFPRNGAFDENLATLIAGDFNQLVYAIRSDIEYKVFTEGVVQDPATGNILYNLMQNDMVALRAVMRLGWEIPNPTNAYNAGKEGICPFAVLSPDAVIGVSPTSASIAQGANTSVTISNGNGKVTAKVFDGDGKEVKTKVTATVGSDNKSVTVAATADATAGSYSVVVTDEAFDSATIAVTVTTAGG